MSSKVSSGVHIFGVRHLSPGGAKHLLDDLNRIQPTVVLIEGPTDATSEIHYLTQRNTKPPVAILAFTEDLPVRTALWPLAAYSPEYQAMKWAADHGAQASFIDLPSSIMIALQDTRKREEQKRLADPPVTENQPSADEPSVDTDTISVDLSADEHTVVQEEALLQESLYDQIARLAGEDDYDMYWERNYEHNLNKDAYQQAILAFSEQMRELTEQDEQVSSISEYAYNAIRESYMRRQIKAYLADGYHPEQIVVICGAYHAAALDDLSESMTDQELASLPTASTKLTLMPYSYYKLSAMSGYGAGNHAPHYYELMWQQMNRGTLEELPHVYLSSVARLLRQSGTHRSTAEVIEAVRMAQSLSALHGGSLPVLRDLQDAAQTLLGHGDLATIAEPLAQMNVGTAIGSLAEGVSQTPIQDDLNRLLKQLKLTKYKTTVANDLALDLRENRRVHSVDSAFLDLNRSFLFHRLRILHIDFVRQQQTQQEQATWAEHWIIQWTPEVEIQIVESTLLGETIEVASAYVLQQQLDQCRTIEEAARLIVVACESGMVKQLENGRQTLQKLAVDNQDVMQIATAAQGLSKIIQYGDIRRIDTEPLVPLLEQLFTRGSLFLTAACQCNDDVAQEMMKSISILHTISLDHDEQVNTELWLTQLTEVMERDDLNPRLSGFACSLLMERNQVSGEQLAAEVSRRLSPGVPADLGAGWFEGLSGRNRYMLLSRIGLWEQLNEYILSLEDSDFVRALVFLRRAFSTFSLSEKNMIAELLGDLWGVDTEQAAEILTDELKEEEAKMIDELNDFDFEDF